ncbi:MAG: hypothetical protein R6U28_05135 [Cyclonatronaceae bacterium]
MIYGLVGDGTISLGLRFGQQEMVTDNNKKITNMTPLLATLLGILILLLILPIGWIKDHHVDRKQRIETPTDYDGMGTYSRYIRR